MGIVLQHVPSGYEDAKLGTVLDLKGIETMRKYKEQLQKAGRAARARRSNPALDGRASHFQKRKVESHRRSP